MRHKHVDFYKYFHKHFNKHVFEFFHSHFYEHVYEHVYKFFDKHFNKHLYQHIHKHFNQHFCHQEYKLKFDERALIFGMIGNTFAAFKGSENKKLMTKEGVKDRYATVANQFAVTEVLAFFISVPVMMATEGPKWGEFVELLMTSRDLQLGLAISGMSFYLYNELATMTIKATGAVTSSVANTAKRVIVMVYMAAVTGKVLTEEQKIGAAIAIGFVLVYSVIDDVLKSSGDKKKKA